MEQNYQFCSTGRGGPGLATFHCRVYRMGHMAKTQSSPRRVRAAGISLRFLDDRKAKGIVIWPEGVKAACGFHLYAAKRKIASVHMGPADVVWIPAGRKPPRRIAWADFITLMEA